MDTCSSCLDSSYDALLEMEESDPYDKIFLDIDEEI